MEPLWGLSFSRIQYCVPQKNIRTKKNKGLIDIMMNGGAISPEEELAGYKCHICGDSAGYIIGDEGVICRGCKKCVLGGQHHYREIMERACYQPNWNGGKR